MAGPTRLPQGVPLREAPRELPSWLAALGSGADQGMDPTTEAIVASAPARRRTTDIELPGLPEPPAAPSMFAPPAAAMQGLSEASVNRNLPPEVLEQMKVRAGFSIPEGIDWEQERAGFLNQGNADREADNAAMQAQVGQSVFPWGRTVSDTVRDDTAFRGLQQARSMTDPAYRREQEQRDELARAETFMDPRVMSARQSSREDAIAEARGLKELGITLGLDPRAQRLEDLDTERRIKVAQAQGLARNPFGAMLGGAAPAANTSAPRGTPMTEAEIRQKVIAMGGAEQDVLDTIEEARAAGLLR